MSRPLTLLAIALTLLRLQAGESQVLPAAPTISVFGQTVTIIPAVPTPAGLGFRINAWADYPYFCTYWPPYTLPAFDGNPAGQCYWNVNSPPSPFLHPPSSPLASPPDVLTMLLTYTYSLPSNLPAGGWNFWAQSCTSLTDLTTCGPMSNVVKVTF